MISKPHWLSLTLSLLGATDCSPRTASEGPGLPATTAKTCAAATARELGECVAHSRYRDDVAFIAQARPPGSLHWQAVQDLCATRFQALGFQVTRQAFPQGINVLGTKTVTGSTGQIILGAHYDHLPACAGADDNASGVAGVLEAARVLAEARLSTTLTVACWDREEDGLLGSAAHAASLPASSRSSSLAVVFEMIGYANDSPNSQQLPEGFAALFPAQSQEVTSHENRADFVAAIGDVDAAPFLNSLVQGANDQGLRALGFTVPSALTLSPLTRDLQRSDHASFWAAHVPALMLSDTAEFRNPRYHCGKGQDVSASLNLGFAVQVVKATVSAIARREGLP